jgi:hypothetical protein
MNGRVRNAIKIVCMKLDHYEDPSLDGSIVFKESLKK